MDKLTHNFLLTLTLCLGAALLLFGCDLTTGKPSASSATNAGAGNPGGAAQISVSDGVILLTPGQPLPTLDLVQIGLTPAPTSENSNPNPDEGNTPTAGPTVDFNTLKLPKGMTIYPGATNLQASAVGGAGVQSLSFHSGDAIDKVMAYYTAQLTQAGWKILNGPANTPGPDGRQVWTWSNNTMSVVSINATVDPKGGVLITVTWMSV
jgi:hypothetical protein